MTYRKLVNTLLVAAMLVFVALPGATALARQASNTPTKAFSVASVPNPRLQNKDNHVSDPGKILDPDTVSAINKEAGALEQRLGVELAVVILKDVGDNDARAFATDLFKHWGIGKKDKDTGLLMLLITGQSQRSIIFETGYGLEGVLPDAECFRLQQRHMIPAFKQGDFAGGMTRGVAAVAAHLMSNKSELGNPPVPSTTRASAETVLESLLTGYFDIILAIILILFLFLVSKANKGGGSRGGGSRGGGSWGGGSSGGGSWGGGSSGGGSSGGGSSGGGSWGGGSSGGGGSRSSF